MLGLLFFPASLCVLSIQLLCEAGSNTSHLSSRAPARQIAAQDASPFSATLSLAKRVTPGEWGDRGRAGIGGQSGVAPLVNLDSKPLEPAPLSP